MSEPFRPCPDCGRCELPSGRCVFCNPTPPIYRRDKVDVGDVASGVGGCLLGIVFFGVSWLLPLAIGIWLLQAAGCV